MIKRCSICGRPIYSFYDLCGNCVKYKHLPWAIALIKIEKHNYYVGRQEELVTDYTEELDLEIEDI